MKSLVAMVLIVLFGTCTMFKDKNQNRNEDTLSILDSTLLLTNKDRSVHIHLSTFKQQPKYIEVEVSKVINRKLNSLSFEVHYQEDGGEKLLVGTFSLYPADNPGQFLIATRNLLEKEGDLSISFLLTEETTKQDTIIVEIKSIRLIDDFSL